MTEPVNDYPLFTVRPGVSPLKSKDSKAIAARIEALGRMSDRHKQYIQNRNALALLELAQEYEDKFKYMRRTAKSIRLEAAEMERI